MSDLKFSDEFWCRLIFLSFKKKTFQFYNMNNKMLGKYKLKYSQDIKKTEYWIS